ncbi:MAG: hypothetical protein KA765_13595 [Thermoflexales bacterium]|nr:hypothetical protein [Thermoflexales bacterium]
MTTPSPDHQPDVIVDGFRAAWQAKAVLPPRPIATPKYRRQVGVFLGIVLASVFGFVSQVLNSLALPNVPFIQPPLGLIGNLVIFEFSGFAIGLACAMPNRSSDGVMRGSVASVLAVGVQGLVANTGLLGNPILTFPIVLGLGLVFITAIPAMMLLRLAIDNQTEALDKPAWSWTRIRVPLGILALIIMAGSFSIFPDHVRMGFSDLHALIQTGLSAKSSADLPPALSTQNDVHGFLNFASADYTLRQSSDSDLWIDLGLEDTHGNAVIVAIFKRGGILACVYTFKGNRLRCKSYVTAKFFQRTG